MDFEYYPSHSFAGYSGRVLSSVETLEAQGKERKGGLGAARSTIPALRSSISERKIRDHNMIKTMIITTQKAPMMLVVLPVQMQASLSRCLVVRLVALEYACRPAR